MAPSSAAAAASAIELDAAQPSAADQPRSELSTYIGVALCLMFLIAAAVYRMATSPSPIAWRGALNGVAEVFADTGPATARLWLFLIVASLTSAAVLLRVAPELGLCDALLGGVALLWISSYLLGQALGPIGLFSSLTLRAVVAAGIVFIRYRPPAIKLHPPTTGQILALSACLMLAVSMLPLQLASPVPPFMDVLSYPSSVQRILTFGRYLPFDNDPYGNFGPYAQTPALELFYAAVALGAGVKLSTLAETGLMLPVTCMIIFGAYRLGRTLFDDLTGGMAALFLFFTCFLRRAQGLRGTAVAFAILAVGLAFFLDKRGNKTRRALGAVLLGTAPGWHAIDGALALALAGSATVVVLIMGDFVGFAAGAVCLGGAVLIAVPEVLIGVVHPLPYPMLPVIQLAGLAIILGIRVVTVSSALPSDYRRLWIINVAAVLAVLAMAIYRHLAAPGTLLDRVAQTDPMLSALAVTGLCVSLPLVWKDRRFAPWLSLIPIAIILGIGGEYLSVILPAFSPNSSYQMMVNDLGWKLYDYWYPYFLIFPAGLCFSLGYRYLSRPLAIVAVLGLIIYPWHLSANESDTDSNEHSVVEHWAINLSDAAQGYWIGHEDRRWCSDPDDKALIEFLRREIGTGRITLATHIVHLSEDVSVWSFEQFPVFTGINADPVDVHHDPHNIWLAGGRVRGADELPQIIAQKPSYILSQIALPASTATPPPGYEEVFVSNYLHLFRLRPDQAFLDGHIP